MLHESPASLPPIISRPCKRRRTATEALAGYFDSTNISRDFFTDMANTDETIRAVTSIIARTSPLLMDSRFQHIASFKSQTHRHSSLNSRLRNNNTTPPTNNNRLENNNNATTTSPIDRRSKLMGRIQDISHLLLSDHYESEFTKRSPPNSHTSLNLPPSTCDTQPDNLQIIPAAASSSSSPSSPQNLQATVLLPTPIQSVVAEDQSPRQPVLPELLSSRRRSPSIVILEKGREEVSDAVVVIDTRTHRQRASMTASPPTPTRSIASLTSHTSSKWPHTPDNEAGPSFPEIPESYSDYTTSYHHLAEADNTGVTIIQPQSPPSSPPPTMWQQGPSVASTSKPPSVTGTPQWMMTQVRHEKLPESSSHQPTPRSRSFSLDNILSPLLPTRNSLPPTPLIAAAVAPPAVDADVSIAMEVDTPSARAEDIRIPLVATPEREMSVASDHLPPKSRSRRRSRAVKVVESDEETEGERERVKRPRESGNGDHRKSMKLKIRIGPLNTSISTSTTTPPMAAAGVVVSAAAPTPTTEMEASSSKEENPSFISMASGTTTISQTTPESLQIDALPPLIPGKARKRKAPPAKKGWKGWVEVEVDEGQRPPKGFSLDDLPVGERRTRSGKQFDG
ncbi:hypothetical protein Clacol_009332 [Clathrus columnatus]|uniref:Uncharacterized protein n=1 Tax=Clathrus columnatus TaxID=1419009 RepID=A0AAV5AMU9_9AGAM|nr:hypothetical protein Clacol_009332 [Clathrus columnatus]